MFLPIRTTVTNTTGRNGNRAKPVRLPYVSRFGLTLSNPGDVHVVDGHLESMIEKNSHVMALRDDVASGDVELVHEIQVDEQWISLEDLASPPPPCGEETVIQTATGTLTVSGNMAAGVITDEFGNRIPIAELPAQVQVEPEPVTSMPSAAPALVQPLPPIPADDEIPSAQPSATVKAATVSVKPQPAVTKPAAQAAEPAALPEELLPVDDSPLIGA